MVLKNPLLPKKVGMKKVDPFFISNEDGGRVKDKDSRSEKVT
jgi:hypothetical protein